MKNHINDELLAGYLTGECTAGEKQVVEEWIKTDPKNAKNLNRLRSIWHNDNKTGQNWDTEKIWQQIVKETNIEKVQTPTNTLFPFNAMKKETTQKSFVLFLRIAAVLLIAASASFLYINYLKPPMNQEQTNGWETLTVDYGKLVKLSLADGSKVTLDAGTQLKYPKSFEGKARVVFINGEGYFEIQRDPNKPFIVHANDAVVKVLGTKFDVRAWDNTEYVKVVVSSGKVLFGSDDPTNNVILTKGEQSTLKRDGVITKPQTVNVEDQLGWMKFNLNFENVSFGEVLFQLERWNNIKFVLLDPKLRSDTLSVSIKNRPLRENLELLSTLMDLSYRIDGNTVIFQ